MNGRKKEKRTGPERRGEPTMADMGALFARCGLKAPEAALKKFWVYHQFLRERNEELNMTRIYRFEEMVVKHYVDCALTAGLTELPSPLLDIGTGAGFPGIPIKIMRPDLRIILAEGRGKRLEFLEEACQLLGLTDVEIYPHKVASRFDLPVRGVITRAVEAISPTLERVAPFLPEGGRVIFMKGPAASEEIGPALDEWGRDYRLAEDVEYSLGGTEHQRRLVVFERISSPARVAPLRRTGEVKEVASVKNPGFKVWRTLTDGKAVKKAGLTLVSGLKQVSESLRDFPGHCEGIINRGAEELPVEAPEGVLEYRLRPELFRELDLFGTGAPLLLMRVPELPEWTDEEEWPDGCTLFVPFQDPSNVGAVIRTAVGLGAARVVMLKEAAHPFHPRSVRAAGPAVFKARLFSGPSINDLRSEAVPLLGLSSSGRDIRDYDFPRAFGLVPGVEGPGLPEHLRAGENLAVPMEPGLESLNAAVAAGLALYEWRRRF